jgi:hypothetical protein
MLAAKPHHGLRPQIEFGSPGIDLDAETVGECNDLVQVCGRGRLTEPGVLRQQKGRTEGAGFSGNRIDNERKTGAAIHG